MVERDGSWGDNVQQTAQRRTILELLEELDKRNALCATKKKTNTHVKEKKKIVGNRTKVNE